MTKITTKTLSRYKSLFTVLLALLLLAIVAAPVSAALVPVYQAGSGASQNANYNNLTAGSLGNALPQVAINTTVSGDFGQSATSIRITLPTGFTFNTSNGDPVISKTGVNGGSIVTTAPVINTARTQISVPVTTQSAAWDQVNFSGIYVDVAATGWPTTGIGYMTISGNSVSNSTGIGLNVTKPFVNFVAVNVTPGQNNVAGPIITINSTATVTSNTNTWGPDGEIGIGTVSISLTGNSGITFNTTFPGTAVVSKTAGLVRLNLTPTLPVVSNGGLTLSVTVDGASNSTSSRDTGGNNQSITFSGFLLDVPSSAVANAKTNFTITTTPTGGVAVSQVTAPVLTVVQPAINFAGVNATIGGRFNLGNPISVNSTFGHPDGEIGNGTVSISLPQGSPVTFNTTFPGTATVSKTAGIVKLNLTPSAPVVSNSGLTLSVTVDGASNSTSSAINQSITFSGYYLDVASTATFDNTYNFTITTTPTNGTAISQINTIAGVTIVRPNITYAGISYTSNGVANSSVGLVPIAINSTFGHPDGEIGNGTVIIRLNAGTSGITFNKTSTGTVVVSKTAGLVRLNVTPFAATNITENGLELSATVDMPSNSTSSGINQSIIFSGWNLSLPVNVPAGTYNFTIITTPTNGTACEITVPAITILAGTPSNIYPVSPNGIYENPVLLVVGTTSTFNWTVLNGTIALQGQKVNFATPNGSSSWLNPQYATSNSTGNVSVTFTAPQIIPASVWPQGAVVYNITATVDGYPLVLNVTNIKVMNGTAKALKIFPDVTQYAPNGIANVTVWAQDQYGNNQSANRTTVRMTSTDADVTILTNDQQLLGGNYTFQVKKSTPGIAHLYVQNLSISQLIAASGEQVFIGDIGSIGMTSTSSSLIANGQEANLTVQLYDLNGAAMALSGATVTFASNNITVGGATAATAPITPLTSAPVTATTATTDTTGKATAYIKSNAAGLTGTIWANVSVTNQSLVTSTYTVPITLTFGNPANVNSTLTASPATVTAGATSTISALIRDSTNNAISGATVNFAITTPGGSLSNSSLVTNSAGYANVTLTTNTTAGTNTVTAISATGDVSKNVSVTTTAGTATKLGFTTDTPNAIGVGSTGSMKAQLLDSNGNLVAATGIPVNFVSSDTVVGTLSPASANTVNGVATVILTGVSGGTTVINASSTGLTSVVKTITVSAATGLTLTPDKTLAAATGSDTITVTLQLIDASGAPLSIAGSAIAYSTTSGTLSVTSGITGATGANVTTITSTTVGQPVITAQINGPSNTTTVTFSGNATQIVVTATPTTATINSLITVNVQAKDAAGYNAVIYNGLPITGQSVIYGYPAAITATNRTNFGATGAASATVTSATANTYTITATGVGKSGSTPVTFTIAPIASNVGVFRNGVFYRNGATDIVYGLSTDTPIIGNWDGTGDNAGVWRNNLTTGSSVFYLDGVADAIGYGIANDTPIVGDWNGDGKSEIGVWRSNISGFGEFYLRNIDGTTTSIIYGLSTDEPIIGDWNGDGMSEVGVWRSNSDGSGVFYPMGADAIGYGLSTDTPIVGDWNGDLTSEVGVWRNSLGSVFYRNGATVIPYGLPTDTPVIGKWA